MGPEHDAELVELAGLRYWNEHEARVVVEEWRRSGESRVAFSRRYGIHPTRLGRWARQMEDRAEVVFPRFSGQVSTAVESVSGPLT